MSATSDVDMETAAASAALNAAANLNEALDLCYKLGLHVAVNVRSHREIPKQFECMVVGVTVFKTIGYRS